MNQANCNPTALIAIVDYDEGIDSFKISEQLSTENEPTVFTVTAARITDWFENKRDGYFNAAMRIIGEQIDHNTDLPFGLVGKATRVQVA